MAALGQNSAQTIQLMDEAMTLPDELRVEEGISPDTIRLLEAKGHLIALKDAMGSTQSIMRDPDSGSLYGVLDPRRRDAATLGY